MFLETVLQLFATFLSANLQLFAIKSKYLLLFFSVFLKTQLNILMFPRQIFYCQYWPEGHFANVGSQGRNVAQQEDRRQEQGKPDDVTIHSYFCNQIRKSFL